MYKKNPVFQEVKPVTFYKKLKIIKTQAVGRKTSKACSLQIFVKVNYKVGTNKKTVKSAVISYRKKLKKTEEKI